MLVVVLEIVVVVVDLGWGLSWEWWGLLYFLAHLRSSAMSSLICIRTIEQAEEVRPWGCEKGRGYADF